MDSKGKVSLEEAFFGSPKGKGSYASRYSRKKSLTTLFVWFSMAESSITNQKANYSQTEVFDKLMSNENEELDSLIFKGEIKKFPNFESEPETFLRAYRRYKKKGGLILNMM